ncbi:unnamed protein product [Ambrosiozyma monospora]|uniref:Unnamed protein product n=1 Tax=Ambrosiozyma monospora TaxID=43982 RepID=A0A9W6WEE8_AMBMO|nr:unnamed protein product [Ambrosiozyma monospora]
MDPWSAIAGGAKILSQDVTYGQVLAAKRALTVMADHKDLLVQLCLNCANDDSLQIKQMLSEDKSVLDQMDTQGLTPLIYAICFNNKECADILLSFGANPNRADHLVGWTPIMWAVYFDYQSIVEQLLSCNADPKLKSEKTKKCALDFLKPDTPMYDYFKSHNYLNQPQIADDDTFYKKSMVSATEEEDAFQAQLKLQTASYAKLSVSDDALKSHKRGKSSTKFVSEESLDLHGSYDEQFDFNVLLPKQYKKFNDESMPMPKLTVLTWLRCSLIIS